MYISLFVDVEDCSTPLSDDVARDIASILSYHGLVGNVMVVGDKARILSQRGRQDVIAALGEHEVGLHSDRHSRHPTVAEYLEDKSWHDGIAETIARERPGVATIRRVFGQSPLCWGQPGGSWGPQVHPAMRQLGVPAIVYPETHTPSSDVHWYGGTLTFGYRNVFGDFDARYSDNEQFQVHLSAFRSSVDECLRKELSWIGLFLGHPIAIRAHAFGDVLNLGRGKETPRTLWQQPPLKSEAEYHEALENLRSLVRYVAAHPHLKVAPVGTLIGRFGQGARHVSWPDLAEYAAAACGSKAILVDDPRLSPAEAVDAMVRAILAHGDSARPLDLARRHVDGPITVPEEDEHESTVSWKAFYAGCARVKSFIDRTGHLPASVELGGARAGIGAFYRAVCEAFDSRRLPEEVTLRPGPGVPAIAETIAHRTERGYRGWVIHKPDLDTTHLIELTRLQTWTLKPATFQRHQGSR